MQLQPYLTSTLYLSENNQYHIFMTEPTSLDIQFTKRFSGNLISNVIYFIANIIFGLALVPYFLDTLGASAYGLIPLATSLTGYVTLVINALNGAVSRYLTIDLQRGEISKANETFNTALFGSLGIVLALTPVALVIAWLCPSFFDIGNQTANDVFLLFALVFASVLIRSWSSNFMVTLFAYNRLDMRNYVNITNLIVQIVIVVLLFSLIGPSLPFVGLSYLIAALVALVLSYILSRHVSPFLTISASTFSSAQFKEMGGVASWLLITNLGLILRGSIALIVVNLLFGSIAGTEYSLALMWYTLLVSISGLVTNCFTPMIYSYRAKEEREAIIRFTAFSTKVTTLFMALPIGLVCIYSSQLLTFWVGAEYASLAPLVWILVTPVIFVIQSSCCAPINAAYKRVRVPAIANILTGILNLGLAFALPLIFNLGMYGVAYATMIATYLLSGVISPIYNAYVVKTHLLEFVRPAFTGIICFIMLLVVGTVLSNIIIVDSIPDLILMGILIASIYSLSVCRFILKEDERMAVRSCIPFTLARIIPKWVL